MFGTALVGAEFFAVVLWLKRCTTFFAVSGRQQTVCVPSDLGGISGIVFGVDHVLVIVLILLEISSICKIVCIDFFPFLTTIIGTHGVSVCARLKEMFTYHAFFFLVH